MTTHTILAGVCECGEAVQRVRADVRPIWRQADADMERLAHVVPCPAPGCFRWIELQPSAPPFRLAVVDTATLEFCP